MCVTNIWKKVKECRQLSSPTYSASPNHFLFTSLVSLWISANNSEWYGKKNKALVDDVLVWSKAIELSYWSKVPPEGQVGIEPQAVGDASAFSSCPF